MIVLIAPEKDVLNEIDILYQLFDAGLMFYHLRKPLKNEDEIRNYLKQIDKKYHKNIVVHQHHNLIKEFDLKGVHLQEKFRINLGADFQKYVNRFRNNDFTVSSSFHHPNSIEECSVILDYYLLSPVFNSISKKGYKGKGFEVKKIDKKIIGMGGVTADNLTEIKAKGFQGAGILGGIWDTENPLEAFLKIKNRQIFNG